MVAVGWSIFVRPAYLMSAHYTVSGQGMHRTYNQTIRHTEHPV